jgi:hypothetical protein
MSLIPGIAGQNATASISGYSTIPFSFIKSVSGNTVYKIRVASGRTGGGDSGQVWNQNTLYSEFFAVRIA